MKCAHCDCHAANGWECHTVDCPNRPVTGERTKRIAAAEQAVIVAAEEENRAEWMEDGSPESGDVLGFARDKRRAAVRALHEARKQ